MSDSNTNTQTTSQPQPYAESLITGLLAGMSIVDAMQSVSAQFGISLSPGAILDFWQIHCLPLLQLEYARSLRTAEVLARDHAKNNNLMNDAITAALQKRILDLAVNPKSSLDDLRKINDVMIKNRNLELRVRTLAFNREKWEFDMAQVFQENFQDFIKADYDALANHKKRITELRMRVFGLTEEQALAGYNTRENA